MHYNNGWFLAYWLAWVVGVDLVSRWVGRLAFYKWMIARPSDEMSGAGVYLLTHPLRLFVLRQVGVVILTATSVLLYMSLTDQSLAAVLAQDFPWIVAVIPQFDMLVEHLTSYHVSASGIGNGRIAGAADMQWGAVSRVRFSRLDHCFYLKDAAGAQLRVRIQFLGIGEFARLVRLHVRSDAIEARALLALHAIAAGKAPTEPPGRE